MGQRKGKGMQLDSLRYFLEIQRAGSMNQAAKILFMTHQGLNKAMSSLEEELGFKLMARRTSGVSLTPEGLLFAEFAESTIAKFDETIDGVIEARRRSISASDRRLNVVTTPYLMHIGFPETINSSAMCSVREMSFNGIVAQLEEATEDDLFIVDLFPKSLDSMRKNERLSFIPLFSTRVGIVYRRSFPLECDGSVTCQEVASLPLAYTCDSTNNGLVAYLFEDTPLENVYMRSTNAKMLLKRVMEGDAVSLFDSYAYYSMLKHDRESEYGDLVFTPFSDEKAWDTIGFLHRRNVPENEVRDELVSSSKLLFARDNATYLKQYPLF